MAAPAHTGMLSVTAINACECFTLCLHLIVLYELILTCPISCMHWRCTLHDIFVSRVAEWKRPPADNGWQSVGGYWKPLPQDLFLAKSKDNHTNHTEGLKSAQKSELIKNHDKEKTIDYMYFMGWIRCILAELSALEVTTSKRTNCEDFCTEWNIFLCNVDIGSSWVIT